MSVTGLNDQGLKLKKLFIILLIHLHLFSSVLFKLSHYSNFVHTNSQEELMGKKFKLNIWRKHMWGFFLYFATLLFFCGCWSQFSLSPKSNWFPSAYLPFFNDKKNIMPNDFLKTQQWWAFSRKCFLRPFIAPEQKPDFVFSARVKAK